MEVYYEQYAIWFFKFKVHLMDLFSQRVTMGCFFRIGSRRFTRSIIIVAVFIDSFCFILLHTCGVIVFLFLSSLESFYSKYIFGIYTAFYALMESALFACWTFNRSVSLFVAPIFALRVSFSLSIYANCVWKWRWISTFNFDRNLFLFEQLVCFCSNVCINTQHNIRRRCSNLDEYFGFCFFVSFLFVHFILFHFILLAHLERFRNSFELVVDLCTILNTLCEFISRTHTHTHTRTVNAIRLCGVMM